MVEFIEVERHEVDAFEAALGEFVQGIKRAAKTRLRAHGNKWLIKEPKDILPLRKELLKTVKQGMGARKNLEVEIAMLACMVWWNRKEVAKLMRIHAEDQELGMAEDERADWDKVGGTGT